MLNETTTSEVIVDTPPKKLAINVSGLPENLVFSEEKTQLESEKPKKKIETTWKEY